MDIVMLKTADLVPYENNPRDNADAVPYVMESIKQFGFKVPIVLDKNNVVIAGHTRLKAAKKLKLKEVPCIIADDLTEEQVKAYRLADNKVAEKAEWDFDLLADELADILEIDMETLGFEFYDDINDKLQNAEYMEEDDEYAEFLDKFEAKKTTDDCYTPDNIYEVVKNWCIKKFNIKNKRIIRPFYPGGDYQNEDYKNCVVIDNPPFSILSEICNFYIERKIPFFLFSQTLTLFSSASGKCNYIPVGVSIIYENGAVVNTSFVTSLGNKKIATYNDLRSELELANKENVRNLHKELPKYEYPDYVITASMLSKWVKYGVEFNVDEKDALFIRELDEQKKKDKSIFGGGFLIKEKAAAEKAAAEKAAAEKAAAEKAAAEKANAIIWELSERELEFVKA